MMRPSSTLILSLTTAALMALTACGGCGGKKKGRGSNPGGATPEASVEPSPVVDESVGEETPPITPDGVGVIDTENAAAVKHLVFETNGNEETGRQLSEYLVVIRAKEDSCVRLKVRPTAGITDQVVDDAVADGVQGGDACSGQTAEGEAPPEAAAPSPTPTASPSPGASLRGDDAYEDDTGYLWATPENKRARGASFDLAGASASICSPRLFRMTSTSGPGSTGLEPTVSKIGLLRAVGSKVRIWIDEEFIPNCSAATAGQRLAPLISWGPLIQESQSNVPSTWKDALYQDHLINLASELDKIVSSMTASYGNMSDIDGSGYVEVFISPDVNRTYFTHQAAAYMDDFDASLIYKPQDLAFYNARSNPTSNEGEILYLWAPDPAGIYDQRQYPSANSLTSNYAKGYAAAQAMTLIMANQRLLVQKQKGIPDPWLLQSLSLLASGYFAGNDYAWRNYAQYMTSRPQYISLTDPVKDTFVGPAYKSMAESEALGMRGMFGWYLHARLCGAATVAPCEALKSLVESTKTGVEAVEALTGLAFKDLMANFALSVGISLADHPSTALAFWDVNPLPAGTPAKPTTLPDMQQIDFQKGSPLAPSLTVESTNIGTALVNLGANDVTQASPFPSKKMLMFQPIAADNDMEFKLAANSVAFILVTGLIDPKTDVTAYFGKGLNVVFVPLGDRDKNMRRMHVEKLSESAHGDLRPENLTDEIDPDTTYNGEPYYGTDPNLQFFVTPSRELWTLGSIDNFKINVGGTAKVISDSDTFEVKILPCDGLSGAAKTSCEATDHQVLVQVMVRDFDKELAPMLLVTDTDRTLFRGHSIYDRLVTRDHGYVELLDRHVATLCQAGGTWPDLQISLTNGSTVVSATGGGAHGLVDGQIVRFIATDDTYSNGALDILPYEVNYLTSTTFELIDAANQIVTFTGPFPSTYFLGTGASNSCANGGVANASVFDHTLTMLDPTAYSHNYENYLSMGAYGYPFTTRQTVNFIDAPVCFGYMCYRPIEAQRQYLDFSLDKTLRSSTFDYFATGRNVEISKTSEELSDDEIGVLVQIKNFMETAAADLDSEDPFVSECAAVAGLTSADCQTLFSRRPAVQTLITTNLAQNDRYVVCPNDTCLAGRLFVPESLTTAWLKPNKFFWYRKTSSSLATYYAPIEPATSDGYCGGDPGGATSYGACFINADTIPNLADIRQQINAPASKVIPGPSRTSCYGQLLGTDFKACIDRQSSRMEMEPEAEYAFEYIAFPLSTDRDTLLPKSSHPERRHTTINSRAGEVLAKPERLYMTLFDVPGTGKIVNIIVGGRSESQGKYLLRARLFNH